MKSKRKPRSGAAATQQETCALCCVRDAIGATRIPVAPGASRTERTPYCSQCQSQANRLWVLSRPGEKFSLSTAAWVGMFSGDDPGRDPVDEVADRLAGLRLPQATAPQPDGIEWPVCQLCGTNPAPTKSSMRAARKSPDHVLVDTCARCRDRAMTEWHAAHPRAHHNQHPKIADIAWVGMYRSGGAPTEVVPAPRIVWDPTATVTGTAPPRTPKVSPKFTLAHIARDPANLWGRMWLRRVDKVCRYCLLRPAETVDHIVPRSQGGTDTLLNLVGCCIECNEAKADRTPKQAGMVLHMPIRMFTDRRLKPLPGRRTSPVRTGAPAFAPRLITVARKAPATTDADGERAVPAGRTLPLVVVPVPGAVPRPTTFRPLLPATPVAPRPPAPPVLVVDDDPEDVYGPLDPEEEHLVEP